MSENLPHVYPDGRMKSSDAALYTGFTQGTLANWRMTGHGPKFVKRGGRVFYFQRDLDGWLNAGGACTSNAQIRLTGQG